MFVNGKLHSGPLHDLVDQCHHSDEVVTRLVNLVPALTTDWSNLIWQIALSLGSPLPAGGKKDVKQLTIKEHWLPPPVTASSLKTQTRTHRLTNLANVMWCIKSSIKVYYPLRPGLCCQCKSCFRNLQAPVNIPTASTQEWYTVLSSSTPQCTDHCRGLIGSKTIHPGSRGLDRGLSVVPEACIGPQQLLDGHPGVPSPDRGCIYHWLHHQAGQQCQETC